MTGFSAHHTKVLPQGLEALGRPGINPVLARGPKGADPLALPGGLQK